jgi:HPt (histidine-containing phosphotransfer) domain-containing protein
MGADPFAPLRREYLEGALARATDVQAMATTAATNPARRAELGRLAHNLRGSGGFYGFAEISDAAAALEELCQGDGGSRLAPMLLEAADRLVAVIRAAHRKGSTVS